MSGRIIVYGTADDDDSRSLAGPAWNHIRLYPETVNTPRAHDPGQQDVTCSSSEQ